VLYSSPLPGPPHVTLAELFGHVLEHIEVGRVATVAMVFPHRHTTCQHIDNEGARPTYYHHRGLQRESSRDLDIRIDIVEESSLRRNIERQ
jgi:hypothetical protein